MAQEFSKEIADILLAVLDLELDQETNPTEPEKKVKQAWYNLWISVDKPIREALELMREDLG